MRSLTRLWGLTVVLVAAVTWAHQASELFAPSLLWSMAAAGLVFLVAQRYIPSAHLKFLTLSCAIAALAIAYTQGRAWQRLQQQIPLEWIGQTHQVTGIIEGIVLRTPYGVRFTFKPSAQQSDALVQEAYNDGTLPQQIPTAWYDDDLPAIPLNAGQEWRLPLGLKPPRATQNEGVFDQEQLWWANNMRGMATVRLNKSTPESDLPQLVAIHHTPSVVLDKLRMAALSKIDAVLFGSETAGVFKALTFGEQSGVNAAQWQVFQQTGVTHLISISGLHITLLASLLAWCVQRLWRGSTQLCAAMPSVYAAQWVGLTVALLYALLSGWALPAQRTVYMLGFWLLLSRIGVAHSGLRVLCLVLWGVLLLDPFAVLTIGFWLSFGAVAWLILAFEALQDSPERTRLQRWGILLASQLAIGVAMLPATVYFFHQASLLGVLVNIIAIPLVSMVLVPLLLLACVLQFVFGWSGLMVWANELLAGCIASLLHLIEYLPNGMWVKNLSWWQTVLLTSIGLLLIWTVQRQQWRRMAGLAAVLVTLVLWPSAPKTIAQGQVQVHVLDVGQGTAVLLQTAEHNWLYDTGPRYGNDSDAGARVIAPYLRGQDVTHIDTMILSHNDADHTGGAASVAQVIEVGQVLSSMPVADFNALKVRKKGFEPCQTGQSWQVDGVHFQILSPTAIVRDDTAVSDNSKSCVLRIDSAQGEWRSMLLTGDIDGLREAELVVSPTGGVRDWASDVVMMPHHGSGASSTAPWIEATQPKMAFAQAGYLNAFHHPLPRIVARYEAAGARVEQTVATGTLRFCLGCEVAGVVKWRDIGWGRRYWHAPLTNDGE